MTYVVMTSIVLNKQCVEQVCDDHGEAQALIAELKDCGNYGGVKIVPNALVEYYLDKLELTQEAKCA